MVARKLTVMQVVPEMDEGGVEGETLDFAIYLARQGHRSIVVSAGGRMVNRLEREGVYHLRWKYIGEKSFRCLPYIKLFRSFFLEQGVDVVHLRSRLPAWLGYLAWKSLDPLKRPLLLTTFHGFYSVNSYSTIMTRGERIIAVSAVIRNHIVDNYQVDPGCIEVIHGGYDEFQFNPTAVSKQRVEALRTQWGLKRNGQAVIMLPGRLTEWKGHEIFIEALDKIRELPFIALCVGDTSEHQNFVGKLKNRITSLGLTDKVILVGHCNDMPAAYLLADIVVSASSSQPEAFGKVAIEAMAMGRPVVATAHGGSIETIRDGETGWLVNPGDPDDLATALKNGVMHPEKLSLFGSSGARWAVQHFTARRMCEKTLSLYQRLLEERARKGRGEVLSVVQMVPELESGGVERGTLEVGKYLAESGHRSIVISGGGRLVSRLVDEGSTHIHWKVGSKNPITLRYLLPLRRLLINEQIDILHLRSRMPAWLGYVVWKSLPRAKRPVLVTTFHGFYSVNRYSAVMTKGVGIIAISKSIRKHILDTYKVDKPIQLIFRGVDKEKFDPALVSRARIEGLRRQWQVPKNRSVIMLPGRLTRWKGQNVFVEALSRLDRDDFFGVIVGDLSENPVYVKEIKELIKTLNLDDKVALVGYCDDMPAALMLADLVISASSDEPEAFGRITIEAMAMGKPVIATAHGGSLETVRAGKSGWLVEPGNPTEMARALGEALAAPEVLVEFGRYGKDVVDRQFTLQSMCEMTVSFYKQLWNTHRKPYRLYANGSPEK
jgi:glycosyltransferase involved in cell wall biosynthesis